MDERTTRYIGELEHELKKLPARDREDALREIRSHLQEASESGTPSPVTLARLGSPRNLAAAYMGDYLSASESSLPTRAVRVVSVGAYVFGTTFSSLFVVPTLAASAFAFGIAAVVTPILGLMRTFGATWIHMDIPGYSIPTAFSFPVGLLIGVVCIGIAALSVAALRLYLQVWSALSESLLSRYWHRHRPSATNLSRLCGPEGAALRDRSLVTIMPWYRQFATRCGTLLVAEAATQPTIAGAPCSGLFA